MIIAITGATGQLGRLAITALKSRAPNATLVGLVRDPAKAADLGVETRAFDYTRPETMPEALTGIDVLVLISSSDFTDRVGQHFNVVDAAARAGVGRLIYTSILRAEQSTVALASDHKITEVHIKGSGLPYTLLRNGWYTENYTASLRGALEHGAMVGSAGEGQVSSAARLDYAEAIAAAAIDTSTGNRVHELAGDSSYTHDELAAEVARATGKPFVYSDLPAEEYAKVLGSFGLPATFAATLADADVQVAAGALFDESGELSTLIGRPTTPLADVVRDAVA